MARRTPRPMAHCLSKPSPRLAKLLRRVAEMNRVNAVFEAALHDGLRGHCRVASIRDRQVLLHVDSAAWATRLRYQMPELSGCVDFLANAVKVKVKVRPLQPADRTSARPAARLSRQSAQFLQSYSGGLSGSGSGDALAEALARLARHATSSADSD